MRRGIARLVAVWLGLVAASPPHLLPLSATSISGQPLRFAADRHEVVVIHFWATWCAPCRAEMPILAAVSQKYARDGVKVVAISLDAGASREKIAAASAGVAIPLARLSDSNVSPRDVPTALPETLVYGRDGRLRYRFQAGGAIVDAATFDRIIPPLVEEH